MDANKSEEIEKLKNDREEGLKHGMVIVKALEKAEVSIFFSGAYECNANIQILG